jgi:putative flippase GtrA
MLPWLRSVRGERYEYELNLLLEAKQSGYAISSVDIAAVYLHHNSGSHFRPLADSIRIYAPLLKFLASSFAAFLVDTVVFLLLTSATDSLLVAVVGARAVSSAVNFLVNRRMVFEHGRDKPATATGVRYFSLALVLLAANYGVISILDALSMAALPAKILTEIALLAVSYVVQQRFLFSRRTASTAAGEADNQTLDLSRGHHPGTFRR